MSPEQYLEENYRNDYHDGLFIALNSDLMVKIMTDYANLVLKEQQ